MGSREYSRMEAMAVLLRDWKSMSAYASVQSFERRDREAGQAMRKAKALRDAHGSLSGYNGTAPMTYLEAIVERADAEVRPALQDVLATLRGERP